MRSFSIYIFSLLFTHLCLGQQVDHSNSDRYITDTISTGGQHLLLKITTEDTIRLNELNTPFIKVEYRNISTVPILICLSGREELSDSNSIYIAYSINFEEKCSFIELAPKGTIDIKEYLPSNKIKKWELSIDIVVDFKNNNIYKYVTYNTRKGIDQNIYYDMSIPWLPDGPIYFVYSTKNGSFLNTYNK